MNQNNLEFKNKGGVSKMKEYYIDSKQVGESLKGLRLAHHLTQIELGEILGYSERTIRRIEVDGTMDLEVVNMYANKFKVPVINILSGMF